MTAEGFRQNEFLPYGRLAQSIAFLSPPGIERLYSGVTIDPGPKSQSGRSGYSEKCYTIRS